MNHRIKGIIRYPHPLKPYKFKESLNKPDSHFIGVNILLHKDDPQLQYLENIINEKIANSQFAKTPEKVKGKNYPIQKCKEESLSDYFEVRIKTGISDVNLPTEKWKVPVLGEDRKPFPESTDEKNFIGKIGYAIVNCDIYTFQSIGVKFYFNGLLVTSQNGPLSFDQLSKVETIESMFEDVFSDDGFGDISEVSQKSGPSFSPPVPPSPYIMTEKANGLTRDAFKAKGWTDEQLIAQGFMVGPSTGVPSFLG